MERTAAQGQVTTAEAQTLSQLLDEDPNPVLRVSADGTVVYANRGSWLLLAHWKAPVGRKVPPEWIEIIREVLAGRDEREVELSLGFRTWLLVVVPVSERGYANLYGLDVTRRRQIEEKLRLNAQVFENTTEGIMICDPELRILDVNQAFCAITGYSRDESLGEFITDLGERAPEQGDLLEIWDAARRRGSWRGEVWDRRKNGERYPKWLSVSAVTDSAGSVSRFVVLFSDITAVKRTEEQLYTMAHYDSLTGLANRRYFQDILERGIKRARRTGETLAVLFVDLDSFKVVNDNLGHRAGDELLCEIARRIKSCVRESDTVARMGGDEFTVILSGLKAGDNVVPVAQKILKRIADPVTVEGQELFVTGSVGIAVIDETLADPEAMLRSADTAMYRAKERGRNGFQFFSPEMNSAADERLVLQARLRRAIDAGEFIVHYQPQVRLDTGRTIGLEALVRWQSPERGLLAPGLFVPMAERTGQICDIESQVLRMVCWQASQWCRQGVRPVHVAVNVSANHLWRSDFVPLVESLVNESRLPPGSLEFELTESALVEDNPETLVKLERLKALGVSLAIDDFGTKYSSLAYLKKLPIDRMKIDLAFVRDITVNSASQEITAAIIAMGRSLKLGVIAEGVETEEQARLLRDLGCPCGQGHFYAPALSPEAVPGFLAASCRSVSAA